jgi:hypothetical protein
MPGSTGPPETGRFGSGVYQEQGNSVWFAKLGEGLNLEAVMRGCRQFLRLSG